MIENRVCNAIPGLSRGQSSYFENKSARVGLQTSQYRTEIVYMAR